MPVHPKSATAPLTIRLPKDQLDGLKKAAGSDSASLNAYIGKTVIPDWLAQHAHRKGERRPPNINDVQRVLTDRLVGYLLQSTEWISDSLLDVQWYQDAESIFGERIHHFEEEKKNCLARKFATPLVKRICGTIQRGKKVFLLIDSGTTTYWLFRHLAREIHRISEQEGSLLGGNLVIVTNNIAGVDSYMAVSNSIGEFIPHGEPGKTKLSDFVECRLLTGRVLTDYAALTGIETEEALQKQRDENQEAVFMGVVVGNWVWLPRGEELNRIVAKATPPDASDDARGGWVPTTYYPVPLARDHALHRHLQLKEKMIAVADEIYVLSPLGKVFWRQPLDRINAALREGTPPPPEYRNVSVDPKKRDALKLITSTRPTKENLLITIAGKIEASFHRESDDVIAALEREPDIRAVPSILFVFDLAASLPQGADQTPIEFPHKYTQRADFMREFFFVD